MKTGTQGAATAAAKEIYWSGISDARLGDALNERLLRDYAAVENPQRAAIKGPRFTWTVDETYAVALVEALASLGMPGYDVTFEKLGEAKDANGSINKRVRKAALNAPKILKLRTGLNGVMAGRENHIEGEEPLTSMLINLLNSDERLYRDFALDRIYREKLVDSRLLDVLNSQVLEYVQRGSKAKPDWKDEYLRRNIKWLGLSGQAKYLKTMEQVLASNVDAGAKKYAGVAAQQLQ
ncbi:MAG: hypothetical protein QM808_00315 [Steroidobacteraceae bacterium]